jgi:uncharacterized protein YneR
MELYYEAKLLELSNYNIKFSHGVKKEKNEENADTGTYTDYTHIIKDYLKKNGSLVKSDKCNFFNYYFNLNQGKKINIIYSKYGYVDGEAL